MKSAEFNGSCNGVINEFSLAFELCRALLYAKALKLLGCGEEARDAVQDTYIK